MTIGERIKAKRKEKNISVEYVAKALGVSVSTVYRYEDSTIEKIPIKVFDKLCQIFETCAGCNGIYAQDADTGGIWRL